MLYFFFFGQSMTGREHIPSEVHMVRKVVVQIRESNLVLCSNWLSDDDLVDVVKLIPVFISIAIQSMARNIIS